jgi:hypothetical protein
MSRYDALIYDGAPYEEFWVVRNDGHVIFAKAYKVEDILPNAVDSEKWEWAGFDENIKSQYDRNNPRYIVPDADYTTSRGFMYDNPYEAALVALDRWEREQDRQDARMASIRAALDS